MYRIILIICLSLLTVLESAQAQSLRSILRKHYSAVGNKAIRKAEAIVYTGKLSQMGMELPFSVYQKRSGKVKFEATYQGMKLLQVYNGKDGWAIDPMSSPKLIEMGTDEKKTMENMAEIGGRLYNWKGKKYKVSYEGNEDFGGVKMFKIKLKVSDDDTENYYINSNTYLIDKVDSKKIVQGMKIETTSVFSDYRDIKGYRAAFKIATYMMGQESGEIEIFTYEIKKAEELPDTIFEKPDSN